MSAFKIIRDPVHDIIAFDARRDGLILELINAPGFQRLRNIRQLGLSWVAFPGAEHSRFTHALGACHLANRVLTHLGQSWRIEPLDRMVALVAALLHDVGHGPFSHLYESVFPNARSHEAWSVDIITHPESDVHRVLAAWDPTLPDRVAAVLQKTYRPLFVSQLVSSQLDVDRFDYLLRDSRMTGAQYGLFDIEWIINAMVLADIPVDGKTERSLAIDATRGLHSVEQHLLGRHFMYKQVYFHPTCRGADMLARSIFHRLTQIELPAGVPPGLADAAAGRTPDLRDYLELDDFVVLGLFKEWGRKAADPILRDLSGRLVERRLFDVVDWSGLPQADREARFAAVSRAVAAAGFDTEYYALMDHALDIPYKDSPYQTTKGVPSTEEIWIVLDGGLRRLSEVSDMMSGVARKAVAKTYACFPKEARQHVDRELATLA